MSKPLLASSIQLIALWMVCAQATADETDFATENDKSSYAIGLMIADSVKTRFSDADPQLIIEAMQASLAGEETRLSIEEAQQAIQAWQQKKQAEEMAARDERRKIAREEGQKYLQENASREEVEVTESGLQWEVLVPSEGDQPDVDDTVVVHYKGTLIDGTEFDSSIARGQPATYRLKGVIPGWTEGLQLMNVGSKYRFVIPSELAYGERGAGRSIGPDEVLVFEIELIEIK